MPTGDTAFQFKAGGLEFRSTSNEYLVISGSKATYRGTGSVNGVDGYAFQLTVIDGAKTNTVDRFRIKIWEDNQGNAVVYDNELGIPDGADPPPPSLRVRSSSTRRKSRLASHHIRRASAMLRASTTA